MPASAGQRLKSAIIETARLSRLSRLLPSSLGGVGAIIAMHRVRPASEGAFQPNRTLEVTPEFLDRTLEHLRRRGIDIVSLDEMHRRLCERDFRKRFVCFTLDDGYADNYEHGFPVFKAHDAPFAIYLTTGFLDGSAFFWWMLLEEAIRTRDEVTLRIEGETERRPTRTLKEKNTAFSRWHDRFRALSPDAVETASRHLCEDHGIDAKAFHLGHAMTWDMAREIVRDGLGMIEAHTERHIALSLQEPGDLRGEMVRVRARIAEETGKAPRHFAFPFGDDRAVTRREIDMLEKDFEVATATTTRADVLRPYHAEHRKTLPRIVLNGYYQSAGFVELALSGLPYMLTRS